MPAKCVHKITVCDDLAMLEVTSSDPRRNGRVDAAIFDVEHLDVVAKFQWTYRMGEIVSTLGFSFSTLISSFMKYTTRRDDNEIYTADCYVGRSFTAEQMQKAYDSNKTKYAKRISDVLAVKDSFFPKIRYKSKKEVVELPILIQNGRTFTIKINAFLAQYVPKTCLLVENRLHIRSENDVNEPSILLSSYIIQRLGQTHAPNKTSLSDPTNYVMEIDTMVFEACNANRQRYFRYGDVAVLELELRSFRSGWYPDEVGWRYPALEDYEAETRYVWVAFDACFLDRLKESEYDWTVRVKETSFEIVYIEEGQVEVILLKRLLAQWSGYQLGMHIVPSRMNKLYKRAIESDNYSKRAKFENMTNDEKHGNRCLYTEAKKVKYRKVVAGCSLFVEEMNDGCGQWCIDMRKDSLMIGRENDSK